LKTITLPDNDKVRVLAISVANENPAADARAMQLGGTGGNTNSAELTP
jgi:hypothetical protein